MSLKNSESIVKEPELSPDLKYLSDCILDILEESNEKLQIVFLLLNCLNNPDTFSEAFRTLSDDEQSDCFNLLKDIVKSENFPKPFPDKSLDYRFSKLLNILFHCSPNFDFVADCASEEDRVMVDLFQGLLNITEGRLKKSPISQLNKEKQIHHMKYENEGLQKNLRAHRKMAKSQKVAFRWQLALQAVLIQKYEEDLAIKKWDNNVRIKQEIVKSGKLIHEVHTTSLGKQKELQEELDALKQAFEETHSTNLQLERQFKNEKNELLLELQTLIKKFDQTIGDKTLESMALQEEYDAKKKDYDTFMAEFEREEMEYNDLVKEKKAEERRKHQEKVLMFMMNRAARNVQRYWRKYRRDMKKKSKKKKGKKKG